MDMAAQWHHSHGPLAHRVISIVKRNVSVSLNTSGALKLDSPTTRL
jgi:hypothetical protein